MILKIFSVLDTKTGVFGIPIFDLRKESVLRAFSDRVNNPDPNNMWNRHPEDFALYEIGEFDDDTATLKPKVMECLVTAAAVKTISKENNFMMNALEELKKEVVQ